MSVAPKASDIPFRAPDDETNYRQSARYVLDLLRAGDPETLESDLALIAIDAIEQRDAARLVLRAALARVHEMNRETDRLREQLQQLRQASPVQRSAARAA